MVDYYFYFDRKSHNVTIFRENCKVKAKLLLAKKRILGEVTIKKLFNYVREKHLFYLSMFSAFICFFIFVTILVRTRRMKGKKKGIFKNGQIVQVQDLLTN